MTRPTEGQVKASAQLSAIAHGCNCKCDITIKERKGVFHADVNHENWCVLLRKRDRWMS
jgi:hypothetical protein